MEPAGIRAGLAFYGQGAGEPLLLMPYPHGFMLSPMITGELARILIASGRQVLSFDPPGSFASTRPATCDLDEMLDCGRETLAFFGIELPVDLVGHSMGSLCSIGYTLERPDDVRRLVLIGTMSGWPAVWRHGRHRTYSPFSVRFWRLAYLGTRVQRGWGSLKTFKQLYNLMESDTFYDPGRAPVLAVEPGDEHRPIPIRMGWTRNQSKVDFRNRLGEINQSTLVCAGKHDIETAPVMNEEVAAGIPNARLVMFEKSGHAPFIEEPQRFAAVVGEFLN
ncbi:MAG: alpha/beta hydrolase [Chloroflexota bacterium]|jgi:pimeloyl-ACP methyl ester carboxylesterase